MIKIVSKTYGKIVIQDMNTRKRYTFALTGDPLLWLLVTEIVKLKGRIDQVIEMLET